MRGEVYTNGRIIDTFRARDLHMPTKRSTYSDKGRYSAKEGYGLELRKRKLQRPKTTVI